MTDSGVPEPLDQPPPVEGRSICGVVTDFEGLPLVGVRVEAAESGGGDLDLLPVLSDGEGAFEITGLAEDGRYDLRFSLGTVKARTLAVPVGTDQLRVKLARPQGILLVVKTGAGQPPPDLTCIVLERATPRGLVREYFGRSVRQRVLLWSIRPGRYSVTVWGGSYLPVVVGGVSVAEGRPAPEVEVLLSAQGGMIGGEVLDANGEACAALVSWRRVDEPGHVPLHMTTQRTGAEGGFLVRGLPAGRYRISAYCEERGLADAEVDVVEEQSHTVTLRLA